MRTQQESNSGIITLQDENPYIVERMLLYLYVLDYSTEIATGADHYASHPDYVDPKNSNAALQIHIAMYAIAERRFIPSLKVLAKAKFVDQIRGLWPVPGFPLVAYKVFSSTPETDRGLRDVVAELCVHHAAEIINNLFGNAVTSRSLNEDIENADQQAREPTWADVLTENGTLATEILARVVKNSDEELTEQRGIHEDTVDELQKARRTIEIKNRNEERYEKLKEDFADYKAMVRSVAKITSSSCYCGAGYRVFVPRAGSRSDSPRLRFVCVGCGAGSG